MGKLFLNGLTAFMMAAPLLMTSCGQRQTVAAEETVNLQNPTFKPFEEMPTLLADKFTKVTLQQDSSDVPFTSLNKAIKNGGKFYVLDNRQHRIGVFKENGEKDIDLSRRGRGPQEYIQITDFDVNKDGGIWILDGQKDAVYHYDAAGEFVASSPVPTDVDYIARLDGGGFLFGVSPWNESEYKDKEVVVCDNDLKIIGSCIDYDGKKDPNMTFPSLGFIHGEDGEITYNHPIEDRVYVFSPDGKHVKTMHFDFGSKAVPDEYRSNIEPHMEDVIASRFIVNGIVPSKEFLLGCMLDVGRYANVIWDKGNEVLYSTELTPDSICLIGGASDCAIFRVAPTGEEDAPGETLMLFNF